MKVSREVYVFWPAVAVNTGVVIFWDPIYDSVWRMFMVEEWLVVDMY